MKKLQLSIFLIIIGIGIAISPRLVQAGNDLSIECSNRGSCLVTPSNTPLFQEMGWSPGSGVSQKLQVKNASAQKGKLALQLQNYRDPQNLGEELTFVIHETSPTGKILYTAPSLQTLHDAGPIFFDALLPHETKKYFLTTTMLPSASSVYRSAQLQFDTQFGLEFQSFIAKKFSAPETNNVTVAAALIQPTRLPQTESLLSQTVTTTRPVSKNRCSVWVRFLPELIFALWVSWFLILELRFPQYRDWMVPLLSFAFLTTALGVWYFWHMCVS